MARLTRSIPGRRLLVGMLVVFVAAVVPAVVAPTLMCRPADPELEDYGETGPFELTDERGQPFTDAALRDHVTIINFIFTRCDMLCPVTSLRMTRLQEKTFDARDRIKLASFSVDPVYDTPPRLAAYAARYQADPARWRFVTGPVDTMHRLIEGPFMNSMAPDGKSPAGVLSIAHNGRFALVDGHGRIRGAYDSGDIQKLDELIRAARFLARTGG